METLNFVLWNIFLLAADVALFFVIARLIKRYVKNKKLRIICEVVAGLAYGTFNVQCVFPHLW